MNTSLADALRREGQAAPDPPIRSWMLLLLITGLLTGLGLRFVGLSYPPFDNHAFRQTQTLSTIDDFYRHGIDLLHPKVNYMGYPGTYVLEFPVFQALVAAIYRCAGPHVEIVRLLNIVAGMLTTWALYRTLALLLDRPTAVLAIIIYWLAPLNIIYQRSVLIDPVAVLCATLAFYHVAVLLHPKDCSLTQEGKKYTRLVYLALVVWLTAMIKVLYLWPAVLLIALSMLKRRFRLDVTILQMLAIFALAGASFIAWNFYASIINNASPFTRGIHPSSLLGWSKLLDADFYLALTCYRPKWWLGPLACLLYPVGLYDCWSQCKERGWFSPLFALVLIPPTYLLLFANINYPHDYYQLIILPFLSIVPASGLCWLFRHFVAASRSRGPKAFQPALIAAAAAFYFIASASLYLIWMRAPALDQKVLVFQQLFAGKLEPVAPAMLFVSTSVSDAASDTYIPEYLYAGNLWGDARAISDSSGARPYLERLGPAFPQMRYVVFYGTEQPNWLPRENFELKIQDEQRQLYVFSRRSG